jgi:tRNA threonylcarbamoyladenosine biosynthesis protein TsaB
VVPVSSLAAVARQAWENAGQRQLPVCVAMDARMQEVFHANFSVSDTGVVAGLDEEKVSPPGLVAPAAKPFIAAGNGFERFEELHRLRDQATFSDPGLWPRAATVLALAREWLLSHEALPPALAQPVYIRNDVASKPKNH